VVSVQVKEEEQALRLPTTKLKQELLDESQVIDRYVPKVSMTVLFCAGVFVFVHFCKQVLFLGSSLGLVICGGTDLSRLHKTCKEIYPGTVRAFHLTGDCPSG
jgi:hypothetical protein